MSVHKYETAKGLVRYRVAWRDPDRPGRQKSKSFVRKRDADAYDAQVRVAKDRGEPVGRNSSGMTFGAMADEFMADYRTRVAPRTVENAQGLLKHVRPLIGDTALKAVDVPRLLKLRTELADAGIPDRTRARALKLVRQILGDAVLRGYLSVNAADVFRARGALPNQQRKGDVRVFSIPEAEETRRKLLARRTGHAQRDATYFVLLTYAGLRPAEAQALRWERVDLPARTIRVLSQNREGDPDGPVKTARARRTVKKLPAALIDDLRAWQQATGGEGAALLFPGAAGGAWTKTEAANWTRRAWSACAPDGTSPYDARHTCASLLLRSGMGLPEVARQMGHSVAMLTSTYAHVIDAHEGRKRLRIDAEISAARRRL